MSKNLDITNDNPFVDGVTPLNANNLNAVVGLARDAKLYADKRIGQSELTIERRIKQSERTFELLGQKLDEVLEVMGGTITVGEVAEYMPPITVEQAAQFRIGQIAVVGRQLLTSN